MLPDNDMLVTCHMIHESSSGSMLTDLVSAPEMYAHKMFSFSKLRQSDSYFSGLHYERLWKFLISIYQSYGDETNNTVAEEDAQFATICDLTKGCADHTCMQHFRKPVDFAHAVSCSEWSSEGGTPDEATTQAEKNTGNSSKAASISPSLGKNTFVGRIVFLRGFPSPDWLNQIGASLQVDPEFIHRHMEVPMSSLPSCLSRPLLLPTLPSDPRYHSTSSMQYRVLGHFKIYTDT